MRGCIAIHLERGLNDDLARTFARAFLRHSGTERADAKLRNENGRYTLSVCGGPFVQGETWTEYGAVDMLRGASKDSGVDVREINFVCGGE